MNQDLIWTLEASYKLGATDEKALISAYQQNPEAIKMIDNNNKEK